MNTYLEAAIALLGGLGLFMLGMWLLSDGLKAAAGSAMRHILAAGTRSTARALLAGIGLTALVQSSTAVTVATVGFVNAGLLSLSQALGVIYGSNVGTTMTGWIVAMTGVEVKLDTYALPAIGIGMILRLSGPGTRRAAWGQALAGLALFLLGIQALKTHFAALATHIDFGALPTAGVAAIAIYFLIGLLLTALIHSSSATTAIVLTAVSAGILPPQLGALVIIGADLGTSSTAVLAAIGASANARRVALSHVLFNAVTAAFAILTLPWLLAAAGFMQTLLSLPDGAAMQLAVFSTLFNLLGVLLMLPLTQPMTAFLERRYHSQEDDLSKPRFLDDALLDDKALAVRALRREVQRLGSLSLDLIRRAAGEPAANLELMRRTQSALVALGDHIGAYIGRLHQSGSAPANGLAALLRAMQHYEAACDIALAEEAAGVTQDPRSLQQEQLLRDLLVQADTAQAGFDAAQLAARMNAFEQHYQQGKAALLEAAAIGNVSVNVMENEIQHLARLRRIGERVTKAAQRLTQQ